MKSLVYSAAVLLCVVDQVIDQAVIAEVSEISGKSNFVEMPKILIPCSVKEGDIFHVINIDGVVEVRCGEPDPS